MLRNVASTFAGDSLLTPSRTCGLRTGLKGARVLVGVPSYLGPSRTKQDGGGLRGGPEKTLQILQISIPDHVWKYTCDYVLSSDWLMR